MAANSIVEDIYQQFINYFGEDRVDIQGLSSIIIDINSWHFRDVPRDSKVILVHWKDVTVTNEYDESVEIWDLYNATIVTPEGKLVYKPLFNRSTYDNIQWMSDYSFSHLHGINKSNIKLFRDSCLGSGPINNTIDKLKGNDCTDMDVWGLYCWELDKYVHVESLTGVPYRKIKDIGTNRSGGDSPLRDFPIKFSVNGSSRTKNNIVVEIFKILIKNKVLNFSFYEGHYVLATPYVDTVMLISNAFIDYYNTHPTFRKRYSKNTLYTENIMCKMYLRNGIFSSQNSTNISLEAIAGTQMFIFKGKPVKLAIKDFHQNYDAGEVHIINIDLLGYIVYTLLKFINMKYGKSKDNIAEKARII